MCFRTWKCFTLDVFGCFRHVENRDLAQVTSLWAPLWAHQADFARSRGAWLRITRNLANHGDIKVIKGTHDLLTNESEDVTIADIAQVDHWYRARLLDIQRQQRLGGGFILKLTSTAIAVGLDWLLDIWVGQSGQAPYSLHYLTTASGMILGKMGWAVCSCWERSMHQRRNDLSRTGY